MYYYIDNINKVIFGYSPKCGCSHVKILLYYLRFDKSKEKIKSLGCGEVHKKIQTFSKSQATNYIMNTPEKIDVIIVTRHPFKRLVSGFIDKYCNQGQYVDKWPKHIKRNLSNFVKHLEKKNWKIIDRHHFEPQSVNYIDFTKYKNTKTQFFDISNIDYNYISKIYNKKIPDAIINRTEGHERRNSPPCKINADIFDNINVDRYCDSKINKLTSYSNKIKEIVYRIYILDYRNFNYKQ